MTDKPFGLGEHFRYGGETGHHYVTYREHVRWLSASIEDEKLYLLAPRLVGMLTGPAKNLMKKYDPDDFRKCDGVDKLLKILAENFHVMEETEMGEKLEVAIFADSSRRQGREAIPRRSPAAFTCSKETPTCETKRPGDSSDLRIRIFQCASQGAQRH